MGPKATPVKSDCKAFRVIRDLSVPKAIKGLSDRREIPVLWDHPDQKGNAAKREIAVLPENKGLSACRVRRAN